MAPETSSSQETKFACKETDTATDTYLYSSCMALYNLYIHYLQSRHLNDTGVKSLAGETKEETKATVEWLKWETSILKAKFSIIQIQLDLKLLHE